MGKIITTLSVALVLILLAIGILLLLPEEDGVSVAEPYTTCLEYSVIDGMPCVRDTAYRSGGISCDWTQWDGQVRSGEIVIPK